MFVFLGGDDDLIDVEGDWLAVRQDGTVQQWGTVAQRGGEPNPYEGDCNRNDGLTAQGWGGKLNPHCAFASDEWELQRGDGVGNQIPIVQLHSIIREGVATARGRDRETNSSKIPSWDRIP